jgi:hypothetical protein
MKITVGFLISAILIGALINVGLSLLEFPQNLALTLDGFGGILGALAVAALLRGRTKTTAPPEPPAPASKPSTPSTPETKP